MASHHQGGNVNLLVRMNLDVLICIASNLDTTSLSRLSQTCRSLYNFTEEHGWKSLWLSSAGASSMGDAAILSSNDASSPAVLSSAGSKYKQCFRVDKAWATKTFHCQQARLPFVATPSGKVEKHQPQPLLLLTPTALLLFTGSEMRVWSSSTLRKGAAVQLEEAQIFYLTNPAGLDSKRRPGTPALALWDICACTQIDVLGEYIAIGRLNGMVEIIRFKSTKWHPRQKQRVQVNLVWLWRDLTTSTSIQAMHGCPSSGLLAIAGKNGSMALFKCVLQKGVKASFDLLIQWKVDSRPWSVWVHESQWLAIGVSDVEPVLLYPLQEGSSRLGTAIHLGTSSARATSVYALQTKMVAGRCTLLAGCYDGVLREYNITEALLFPPRTSILPQRQLRDRFDPSAIYSLCLGVGQRGEDVAAGTARYGVCKVFRSTGVESDSWSMFAAYPSQSPTYSIVGQHDRLFGVTDALFWQIDLRPGVAPAPSDGQDNHTLALYKHGDMVLEKSRCP